MVYMRDCLHWEAGAPTKRSSKVQLNIPTHEMLIGILPGMDALRTIFQETIGLLAVTVLPAACRAQLWCRDMGPREAGTRGPASPGTTTLAKPQHPHKRHSQLQVSPYSFPVQKQFTYQGSF